MMRLLFSVIMLLFLVNVTHAQDYLSQQVLLMRQDRAAVTTFFSSETGGGVLAIGSGIGATENDALELARVDALKKLAGFLRGEEVSGKELMQNSLVDGKVSHSFYVELKSNVEATVQHAQTVASGLIGEEAWVAVAVTEKSAELSMALRKTLTADEVVACGYASLQDGEITARKNALAQAIRNAAEQFGTVQTAARSTVANSNKLHSELTVVSEGMVSQYSVVKEYKKDGLYFVEIVAKGALDTAQYAVAAVTESLGRPSFYVDIQNNKLKGLVSTMVSRAKFLLAEQKEKARYLIRGHVFSDTYSIPADSSMLGVRSQVTLAVFDQANAGEALFQVGPEQGIEISANSELRILNSYSDALQIMEKDFIGGINRVLHSQFMNGSKVKVSLYRHAGHRDVEEFKKCVASLSQLKQVIVSSIEEDVAEFELIYVGHPQELASEIMSASERYRLHGLREKKSDTGSLAFSF